MPTGTFGPLEPQPSGPLAGEMLYTLQQIAKHKQSPLCRTYRTYDLWRSVGAENLSGDIVKLECVEVRGIQHSSLEAVQRFIAAQNSQTLKCRIIGGCLDGLTASVSDHLKRFTSGQLIRDGKVNVKGGVPADHLYYRTTWTDRKGALCPFLVWSQCEDSEQKIRAIVENA